MNPKKEIEMKQQVLEMLKEFMMGEEGNKFKPKAISVEMIGKPKESLIEEPQDEDESEYESEHETPADEDEEDCKKGKMSLKDFLSSRSE